MEPSELIGIAVALIALSVYVMNAAYSGIVADEKGFSNNAPIFLAMFTGPLVWLYLIARPITPDRLAGRQLDVEDAVARLRALEARAGE